MPLRRTEDSVGIGKAAWTMYIAYGCLKKAGSPGSAWRRGESFFL